MENLSVVKESCIKYQFRNNKTRESGLELLRIIAMLLVVMHHVILYSKLSVLNSNQTLAKILLPSGKIGVNIFYFITGYFMVEKNFKISRVLNLVIQTSFYSIVFYLIFL